MVGLTEGRIVGAITQAALDPGAWQRVTDAILETFPGTKPGIVRRDLTSSRSVSAAYSGYDPSFRPSFEAHYSRVIPKVDGMLNLPLGQVACDQDVVADEELLRSEFYNDWLRPQGDTRHGVFTVLQHDPRHTVLFAARVEHRVADQALSPLLRLTRDLYPLMHHALEVNRMTLGLRLDAALLRHGVEPDGASILLLGPQGSILCANTKSETLLSDGRLISHDPMGRLRFTDAEAMLRLGSALAPQSRSPGVAFRIRGSKPPQEVRLLQVTPSIVEQIQLPLLMRSPPPQLLVVLRPASDPADVVLHVASSLGLTRAEAEVTLAISEGATVAEAAETRGVSVHTIRDQVKSALSKTGARRQSDLVRLLVALRQVH